MVGAFLPTGMPYNFQTEREVLLIFYMICGMYFTTQSTYVKYIIYILND